MFTRSDRPASLVALFGLVVVLASGCGTDAGVDPADTNPIPLPDSGGEIGVDVPLDDVAENDVGSDAFGPDGGEDTGFDGGGDTGGDSDGGDDTGDGCGAGPACDADEVCEGDVCVPLEVITCVPDEIGCLNAATAFLCNAAGDGRTDLPCLASQTCQAGACVAQICTPETSTCTGDVRVDCDATGLQETVVPCSDLPVCAESTLGCACEVDTCVPRQCTPGALRCAGNGAQTCNPAGTAWSAIVDCPTGQGCIEGTCLPPVCSAGTAACSGDVQLTCRSAGTGYDSVNCADSGQRCDPATNACAARICAPNSQVCATGTEVVLVCDAAGATVTPTACGAGQICTAGACVAQTCTPSARACVEGVPSVCSPRGDRWVAQTACGGGQTCVSGTCVDQVCSPGTRRCVGELSRVCNAGGTSESSTNCALTAQYCDAGQCVARVCTPGDAATCIDGNVRQCDARGAGYTLVETCENGCQSGVCRAPSGYTTVTCSGTLPAPPAGQTCGITGAGINRLVRGRILTPDVVYERGAVLFDGDGEILCAGCDCGADPLAVGATVITCRDAAISPGWINASQHVGYDHLAPVAASTTRFDHRHDWRRGPSALTIGAVGGTAQRRWVEMRALMAGTTAVAGFSFEAGLVRNLDRAGADQGLGVGRVVPDTFPFGDTAGETRTTDCNYLSLPGAAATEASAWLGTVGAGIADTARNEFRCLSETARGGVDILAANIALTPAIPLRAADASRLASRDVSVIWTPRSNLRLYGNTTPVRMLDAMGVRIGLGTDWTPTGSATMQRELACADTFNQTYLDGYFSAWDLWRMATVNNAAALQMSARTGALTRGRAADIVVYAVPTTGDVFERVIRSTPAQVALVLVGGRALYGDTALVNTLADGSCESISSGICSRTRSICVLGEFGELYASLVAANISSYPAVFCDTPANEPTCVPSRPGLYNGVTTADTDGDGVPNASDNCPNVFNPIRPMDGGVQADADGDRVGDACDPCPLATGTSGCTAPNPDDRDGDGIPNYVDNCPMVANPTQLDTDGDGKGDACDACPTTPNPGATPCPTGIHDVKRDLVPFGTSVTLTGIVTAAGSAGFFLQSRNADRPTALGARYSGIYIYTVGGVTAARSAAEGQIVRVTGSTLNYFEQRQIERVTDFQVLGTSAMPTPVVLNPANISSNPGGFEYEGVLVRVNSVQILQTEPPSGPGDSTPNYEYLVTGNLRINDFFFRPSFTLPLGGPYSFVGPLRFGNGNYKIEPRSLDDIFFP